MAMDIQKYRAQFFQISGFCFMSPFGKLVLGIPGYKLSDFNFLFIIYIVISLFLFYLGIIFMFKGEEHLEERRYKWTRE